MRLLVFGASGGTGRLIVEQALGRGEVVRAFVRQRQRLPDRAGLEIMEGDVGDAARVRAALAGQDVVISALGVSVPLRADPVVRAGIDHLVTAMEAVGVRRLVYLSFIGVAAGRAAAGPLLRYVARYPLRHEIADHEWKERRIESSALDWTIVRAPKLTDGSATGQYRAGVGLRAHAFFPRLSRADVAACLLGESLQATHLRAAIHVFPGDT